MHGRNDLGFPDVIAVSNGPRQAGSLQLAAGSVTSSDSSRSVESLFAISAFVGGRRGGFRNIKYVTTTAALAQRSLQDVQSLCAMLGLRARLLPGNQVSRERPGPGTESDLTYASYQKMAFEYLGEHLAQRKRGTGRSDGARRSRARQQRA